MISGNGRLGIEGVFTDRNLVAGNRINGGGIDILGPHNQILRNRIFRGGIVVGNFIGNVVDGNVIDRASDQGILIEWLDRDSHRPWTRWCGTTS